MEPMEEGGWGHLRPEARNWLRQAEADWQVAEATFAAGLYFACAFACHQTVEKGLKGAVIARLRQAPPRAHNLVELGHLLGAPEIVLTDLRYLNPEYVTSRYPDAANGVPAENYDTAIAQSLMEAARRVRGWLRSALTG